MWVSDVVVVTGPGCEVCCDVVVVLDVGAGAVEAAGVVADVEAQAESAAIAMAIRLGTISFFMVIILVWIVV